MFFQASPFQSLERKENAVLLNRFFFRVQGFSLGKYQDFSEGIEGLLLEGVLCECLARLNRQYLDASHFLWFYAKKKEADFAIWASSSVVGIELKW